MEFVNDRLEELGEEASEMTIADVTLPGIYDVVESGSGFTEEYKAERERESGGQDEVDEPPAAELEIVAWGTPDDWEALNTLRQRRDPFPVSVGPFVFEEMGMTNLEQQVSGDYPEAREFTLRLQEFREVIVQRDSMDEVLGGGDAAAGGTPGEVQGPQAGDTSYSGTPETIPSGGHEQFGVESGQTFGGELIDVSASGASATIRPQGEGWVVENVGLEGEFNGRALDNGDVFLHADVAGSCAIRHVFAGHGASNNRDTCMLIHGNTGQLEIRRVNIQGWPDNGVYGSSAGSTVSIAIYDSYAHNNQTSDYRLNSGLIANCVGVRDGFGSRGNRNVWAWDPGPVEVRDCDILNSQGGHAIQAGGDVAGSPTVNATDGSAIEGGTGGPGRVNFSGGASEGGADPTAYHSDIPGSAAEAAEGVGQDTGSDGDGDDARVQ